MGWKGLKLFTRNFCKQKTVGILSIGSLAIAITVVLLIGLWAVGEFTYDHFQQDRNIIYRIKAQVVMNEQNMWLGSTYKAVGEIAVERFPEIKQMCRVTEVNKNIKANDVIYTHEQILEVDPNFFTFFTFPLKTGDPLTCLSVPNGIVIDEMIADRFFPGENPVGKYVIFAGKECTVRAVMYNMPENTHLRGRIVTSFIGEHEQDEFDSDGYDTYFKISNIEKLAELGKGLTQIVLDVSPVFGQLKYNISLQALDDIHFDSQTEGANKTLVVVFLFVAFIILIIACINFINLFISTSFLRARSIGIKKTYGAVRWGLAREFYQETFFYAVIALGLGLILAAICLPLFNKLTGFHIVLSWTDANLYLFAVGILFGIVFLAGTFPALFMTKFNTIETLKGKFKGKNLSVLQRGLIIGQFAVVIVILITVFFIDRQVHYMISQDLGFDKENMIYVYTNGKFGEDFYTFRQEMTRNPSIVEVALKDGMVTEWNRGNAVQKRGVSESYLMEICHVSYNYFDALGMKLKEGEGFLREDHDKAYCIVNESAAKVLGEAALLNEHIFTDGEELAVKGVVKNAQTQSLRRSMNPQVYVLAGEQEINPVILFRIQGDPKEAIRVIENKWNSLNIGLPFEYYFLDDNYAQLYQAETNAGQILEIALGITMLISIAGLFAMAFYVTQRRLKEVGIRKVNGASLRKLLWLLNLDFFIWIGIAFVIACPVAYYIIAQWLENFTVRISISWWGFGLAGSVMFLVTVLTVSYQTWKAAHVNPVKILNLE